MKLICYLQAKPLPETGKQKSVVSSYWNSAVVLISYRQLLILNINVFYVNFERLGETDEVNCQFRTFPVSKEHKIIIQVSQ